MTALDSPWSVHHDHSFHAAVPDGGRGRRGFPLPLAHDKGRTARVRTFGACALASRQASDNDEGQFTDRLHASVLSLPLRHEMKRAPTGPKHAVAR